MVGHGGWGRGERGEGMEKDGESVCCGVGGRWGERARTCVCEPVALLDTSRVKGEKGAVLCARECARRGLAAERKKHGGARAGL